VTDLERILAAVRFEPADRLPVIAQLFGVAARFEGVGLNDYLTDGGILADCQVRARRRFGNGAVFALMDVAVEAEALGAEFTFHPDAYPTLSRPLLSALDDPASIAPPDPARAGRMPELLRAAGLLRRAVGDEALVAGCVVGPMTLAVQLAGMEAVLYRAADDPDGFGAVLDRTAETAIRFGTAQLAAGVHLPLVFEPAGSPDVVPPSFFREFIAPRLTRIFDAFREGGAAANWLHIAGPAAPILPYYAGAGVDLANIDYSVSPEAALAAAPDLCFNGNVRPLDFVEAAPAAIRETSHALIQSFADRGGFLLSSGCEIPLEASPDAVLAMTDAATGPSEASA
jgi:uroporphyrinogen decarboxylase